jgi:glutamate dehydrogenase
MDPSLQNRLMVGVDSMVEDIARWYLLHPQPGGLDDVIAPHRAAFAELAGVIVTAGPDDWRAHRTAVADALVEQGVDPDLARKHAWQPELTHSPDIAQVAQSTGRSLQDVATTFFLVGEQLHIDALEQRVIALKSESRWERWAALAMEDDLMAVRREVAERVLLAAPGSPVAEAVELYLATRSETYERLNRLLGGLDGDIEVGLAALTVALRQVRGVAA